MRADRPQDRALARGLGVVLVLAGVVAGASAFGVRGCAVGAGCGGLVAVAGARYAGRRSARRRALLKSPFPERFRVYLREKCDHYDRLSPEWKARFENDLRLFLLEKRITGVEVEVTDELRLLVAASAITLSLGWPDYEWDQVAEVLLYPQEFDRHYHFQGDEAGDDDDVLAGQAAGFGTVILSVPSLLESFEDPDDAFHVGFHEFAHLLDVDQTQFDGIPAGLDEARAREWVKVAERERERLRKGRSVLDPYGEEDPVEFMAVAVEAFFEVPLAMRKGHRELYALLRDYFRQDPAAADDARGLVI